MEGNLVEEYPVNYYQCATECCLTVSCGADVDRIQSYTKPAEPRHKKSLHRPTNISVSLPKDPLPRATREVKNIHGCGTRFCQWEHDHDDHTSQKLKMPTHKHSQKYLDCMALYIYRTTYISTYLYKIHAYIHVHYACMHAYIHKFINTITCLHTYVYTPKPTHQTPTHPHPPTPTPFPTPTHLLNNADS